MLVAILYIIHSIIYITIIMNYSPNLCYNVRIFINFTSLDRPISIRRYYMYAYQQIYIHNSKSLARSSANFKSSMMAIYNIAYDSLLPYVCFACRNLITLCTYLLSSAYLLASSSPLLTLRRSLQKIPGRTTASASQSCQCLVPQR